MLKQTKWSFANLTLPVFLKLTCEKTARNQRAAISSCNYDERITNVFVLRWKWIFIE